MAGYSYFDYDQMTLKFMNLLHILANVTGTYGGVVIRIGEVIENGKRLREESASKGKNGWKSDDSC